MGRPKLNRRAAFAGAGALVLALAAPAPARAQSAEDKAAADAAFDQGKRLMAAKSYAEACQKFSESLRRDPGIGTMLGLADCFEKNGQTASAWAQFREAAAAAARKSDGREKIARENAQRLEPLLSRLVVHVSHESEVRGIAVKRDGVEVGHALWDTEVPLDPGTHTITASAPGMKEWQGSITIAARPGVQTVNVPALEVAPPQAPTAAASGAGGARAATASDPGRTQRYVAIGVGGVGVIGVAVGAIFGLKASSQKSDANVDNHCDAANSCDETGLALRKDALSSATVSTIGFLVGGVAIAGGVVLWLTAPKAERVGLDSRPAPRPRTAWIGIAPAPGGATLVGAF